MLKACMAAKIVAAEVAEAVEVANMTHILSSIEKCVRAIVLL